MGTNLYNNNNTDTRYVKWNNTILSFHIVIMLVMPTRCITCEVPCVLYYYVQKGLRSDNRVVTVISSSACRTTSEFVIMFSKNEWQQGPRRCPRIIFIIICVYRITHVYTNPSHTRPERINPFEQKWQQEYTQEL